LRTFQDHPDIDEVIIVCSDSWLPHVTAHYQTCRVVPGGALRRQSALNGVNSCNPNSVNILIHDAARPLVSGEIISNCLRALEAYSCAVPVIDVQDSTISIDNNSIKYLNRDFLKRIQTPQGFRAPLICEVLRDNQEGTDELSQVLKVYPQISYILFPGELRNIKITTEDDLQFVSHLLSR